MLRTYQQEEFRQLKKVLELSGIQVGLMQRLGNCGYVWPLTSKNRQRAGLYLTNQWAIEPFNTAFLGDDFPPDIYELADCNDIELT